MNDRPWRDDQSQTAGENAASERRQGPENPADDPRASAMFEAPMPQAHPTPPLAATVAQPPGAQSEPLALKGETYWQSVRRRLFKPLLVRFSAAYIIILALLAVFVPFIANGDPYTIVIKAHGKTPAHREYPLFRTLTSIDLIVLAVFACLCCYLVLAWRAGGIADPIARRKSRLRALLIFGGIALIGSLAIYFFHQNVLDVRNYWRMVKAGRATAAIFPPVHWGYAEMEPLSRNLVYKMPYSRHILGTDGDGRDVLSRLLWATRIVMAIGFISQVIALVLGVIVGALMGYFVGIVDLIGMRLVEIFEAIPTFFLILIFVAAYGRSIFMIMIILGLTGWSGIARFIRAEFFRIRKLDYVTAAIASGLSLPRVLFRHMLPNGVTPVIVSMTFGIAGAVLSESGLSFLGVGVRPPTPSWGSMLNDAGNPGSTFHWYLALAPGILIFLTVLAYNLIGESLRDAIDPQLNV